MSVRDSIIKRTFAPVEIGKDAKELILLYRSNKDVFDADYDLHPLYALLKIMTYAKRCAVTIAKKTINSFNACNARNNYVSYCRYMDELSIAHDEFAKHFEQDEELFDLLDEIKGRLETSTICTYSDRLDLMIDIFDTNSPLYSVEGIGYAR